MPYSQILNAFTRGVHLPEIITTFNLSADDLFNLLSAPGIPERLAALRTLSGFDHQLRQLTAQSEATAYLQDILKDPETPKVEGRRAATAILRGPSSWVPRPSGAGQCPRADISDWSAPADIAPDNPDNDEADDDDADEDADDQPAPDPSTSNSSAPKAPASSHYKEVYLPDNAPPSAVVAYQLATLKRLNKPDAATAAQAIYHRHLGFRLLQFMSLYDAFVATLAGNAVLDLKDAEILPDPAIINPDDPKLASVRILIRHADGRECSSTFHLTLEDLAPDRDGNPRACWNTIAITADDTS